MVATLLSVLFSCFALEAAAVEPDQRAELKTLKKKNRELKKKLREAETAAAERFARMTQSEQAAHWAKHSVTGFFSPNTADDYPAKGAVHARLVLERYDNWLSCPFGSSYGQGGWNVYDAKARAYRTRR